MKYLCLAYGSEEDWNKLTKAQQEELLAADEVIKARGDSVAALRQEVTTITNWERQLVRRDGPFSPLSLPLAGFSIIEAGTVDEVIALVGDSPCARAGGAIEIRPFWNNEAT